MGLLGGIIAKGVVTAARNSTIRAVGEATATVISEISHGVSENETVSVKNGVVLIKPTRSSDGYCGENALDIAQELLGAGFECITLKPVNRLKERAKKEYGLIENISINGKNEFLGIKKVPASSHIVIEYSDFKQNVGQDIYAKVKRIVPGLVRSIPEVVAMQQNQKSALAGGTSRYCAFCGGIVSSKDAKFCSNCGGKIV